MRSEDIVPHGFESWRATIEGWKWIALEKGSPPPIANKGYGPGTYKVFVQPVFREDGKHCEMLEASFGVLRRRPNVCAKFLAIEQEPLWRTPSVEKLVVYLRSERSARRLIRDLCDELGWKTYRYGSAPDMTWGEYKWDYGAGFTHQVNPMIHIRRAGRGVHGVLVALKEGCPLTGEERNIGRYMGVKPEDMTPEVAAKLHEKLPLAEETIKGLINYSLSRAGILELVVQTSGQEQAYLLDPRAVYSIGVPRHPKKGQVIPLASPYSSGDHASIAFILRMGDDSVDYFLKEYSRNGTYVNGRRLREFEEVPLKPDMQIAFGPEDKAFTRIARV